MLLSFGFEKKIVSSTVAPNIHKRWRIPIINIVENLSNFQATNQIFN